MTTPSEQTEKPKDPPLVGEVMKRLAASRFKRDPLPLCPICNKRERIEDEKGRALGYCEAPECIEIHRRNRAHAILCRSVPVEFQRASLADFPEAIRHACDVDEFKSYFLTGAVGVGKSHLAAAITRELLKRPELDEAKWTRTTRLLLELRETFGGGRSGLDVAKVYEFVPVLVLNDLGAENSTEFAMSVIFDVLDARVESRRPTIVTSNLALANVAAKEPRLASRLGAFRIIHLTGRDRRLKR